MLRRVSKSKILPAINTFYPLERAQNLHAWPAHFRRDKVDEFESGSLSRNECRCKYRASYELDRMHVRYRIPINRLIDHWKCHCYSRPRARAINKRASCNEEDRSFLAREKWKWRRRRRRRRFRQFRENGWTRERVAQKDWLTPAFHKFFSPSRGRAAPIPYFSPFLSRESPFLLAQLFFSFDSRKSRAYALLALAIS